MTRLKLIQNSKHEQAVGPLFKWGQAVFIPARPAQVASLQSKLFLLNPRQGERDYKEGKIWFQYVKLVPGGKL